MRYELRYGKGPVSVEIGGDVEVLVPFEPEVGDERELITRALEHPIDSPRFEDFVSRDRSLLVIVNDGTRPTPTARVLEALRPTLSAHPDVRFLVATGAHRASNEEELRFIFGDLLDEFRDRISQHDAGADDGMVHLGTSKNGTEMYINRMVPEADDIVVISSVEPHYFGGYTGGRKSFLPGVASRRTIEQNHRLALSNRARALALDGNPVHEDMMDALSALGEMNVFSIQTVLTGDHRLYAVAAGDLHASFYAAVEHAFKIFCVPLKRRGNIVVTVAPHPMDVDLYQSQKAVENGRYALTDGGVLILVSRCSDGIGDRPFFELLSSEPTPQGVLYRINKGYRLGWHKAAKMAQVGVWAEVWAVTDLDDGVLRAINIRPYHDLQRAVDDAAAHVRSLGKEPRTVLMPDGSLTVPVLEDTAAEGGWVRLTSEVGADDLLRILDIRLEGAPARES